MRRDGFGDGHGRTTTAGAMDEARIENVRAQVRFRAASAHAPCTPSRLLLTAT
jgi:hypothetical protein